MVDLIRICRKNFSITFFIGLIIVIICHTVASAATIELKNGTRIKGSIIATTEDQITVQDPATKQVRVVKNFFIRSIVLEPGDQNLEDDKKILKGGVEIKRLQAEDDGAKRHFLVAVGGGGAKLIDGPGESLGFGYGGTVMFQYNYIWKGFGADLHASFFYNSDKKYGSDYITILPVIASPMYKFNTKYIDIDLRAGAGFSYTRGKSGQRFNLVPTGNPATPLSVQPVQGFDDSSFDLVAGAGAGISHLFNNGLVIGLEVNYYYLFQTLRTNTLSASIYCGYMF